MIRISTRGVGKVAALGLLVPAAVISLAPLAQAVPIGTAINDTATVTPGYTPAGGTVVFQLFGPTDPTCTSSNPVFTDVEPLTQAENNAGVYTVVSANYTPHVAGTYNWVVTYTPDNSGNVNTPTVISACNVETVTVTKVSPTLTTTPGPTA